MIYYDTRKLAKVCFVRIGDTGDGHAFERALRLCGLTGATLTIVTVFEAPPEGLLRQIGSWGVSSVDLCAEDEHLEAQNAMLDAALRKGVIATAEKFRYSTATEVVEKIAREGFDLVIKAAQPQSVVQRLLHGHLDRRLLRECSCPVWIEKSSANAPHMRILAAVDPAPFHEERVPVREALNVSILQFAVLLAELEQAELHVVHAWDFYLEGPLRSRAGLSEEAVAEAAETFKRKHQEALSQLLVPFFPHITRVHLPKGEAAEEICGLLVGGAFDVAVMGTVCRMGLSACFFGNTAETVLQNIECSVVALKPKNIQ